MSNAFTVIAIVIIIACLITISVNADFQIKRLEKDLQWYRAAYLWKQGSVAGTNYSVFSPNGGRDWYAADPDGEMIAGEADEIYPNLLNQLPGFKALREYREEHGPIYRDRAVTQEEIKLLKDAGFTVRTQPAPTH